VAIGHQRDALSAGRYVAKLGESFLVVTTEDRCVGKRSIHLAWPVFFADVAREYVRRYAAGAVKGNPHQPIATAEELDPIRAHAQKVWSKLADWKRPVGPRQATPKTGYPVSLQSLLDV
jgi:hypothetical protein